MRSSNAEKPGARLDGIRAAHAGIGKLVDQDEAGLLGERLDGRALPLVAVLVGADVCGR
jgi:hypothetical protein